MMHKPFFFFAIAGLVIAGCDNSSKTEEPAAMTSQIDSVSYAIGLSVGGSIKSQKIENFNADLMSKAVKDILAETEAFTSEEANQIIQNFMQKKQEELASAKKNDGKAFLDANAQNPDVKVTATGLQYMVITEGTGPKPTAESKVTVHYTGTLTSGEVFDSSVDRGEPATFQLNGVIPGWTEGLQLMSVGSKYKFFIPSDLAYGDRGAGQMIGPGETLVFEVELLDIVE